jgi:hypothetical protein
VGAAPFGHTPSRKEEGMKNDGRTLNRICRAALLLTLGLFSPLALPDCWSSTIPSTYSKSVQDLFKRAQATDARPIIVKTIPSSPQPLQGHTNGEADRIEITVMAGVSRDYDDALLAHELFHVILNSRGFADGGATVPYTSGPPDPELNSALNSIVHVLNSCFSDELIDRETAKIHLKAKLLLDTEVEQTTKMGSAYGRNEGELWPEAAKNGQAVVLFCLAKRIPEPSMRTVEDKLKFGLGPGILDRESKLIAKFKGRRCQINQPDACYHLTLQLRDAAGLKDLIHMRNPKTHSLE